MNQTAIFLQVLNAHYSQHGRELPWREPEADGGFDAYKILVSEIMLQQTQVARVIPKYQAFLATFPTAASLAAAEFHRVLVQWAGLGYNRRAKYLWQAAQALAVKPQPWSHEDLVSLKGIGPNTAAAVLAYSYDTEVIFVETNIRTAIIHHFFADEHNITDKQIMAVLEDVVPWRQDGVHMLRSPREFYWAVMDYGTFLKASVGNLSRKSKSYTKQSAFKGSRRQIRGQVIRLLAAGPVQVDRLHEVIADERLKEITDGLIAEELLTLQGNTLMLYNNKH